MSRNIVKDRIAAPQFIMNQEVTARRGLLRGALAVGFGLWVPIVFSGGNSRNGVSAGSTVLAGASPTAPAAGAAPAAPPTSGKVLQASVQYQSQPKGAQKCSECRHFIAESNTCKLVDGRISPEGWCSLWTGTG